MKDIRTAQIAHKDVKGVFSNNFDSLIKFIDEGIFTLVEKRDSSYLEYDRTYRIDMLKEVVVIDTLGFVPVKDSLFKNTDRYKNIAYIPVVRIAWLPIQIAIHTLFFHYRKCLFRIIRTGKYEKTQKDQTYQSHLQ